MMNMATELIAPNNPVKDLKVEVLEQKNLTKLTQSVKDDELRFWEREYITEHIDTMPGGMNKILCQFLWMTGCRITEGLSVQKKDLDFKNYTCRIRWLKNRKHNARIIPLHPRLKDILEVYTSGMTQEERLFPITRQQAHNITTKYFDGNPHMFRHSFAVNWVRNNGRIELLCRMLGHSDIKYTMIYLRFAPQDIGKELLKVEFT